MKPGHGGRKPWEREREIERERELGCKKQTVAHAHTHTYTHASICKHSFWIPWTCRIQDAAPNTEKWRPFWVSHLMRDLTLRWHSANVWSQWLCFPVMHRHGYVQRAKWILMQGGNNILAVGVALHAGAGAGPTELNIRWGVARIPRVYFFSTWKLKTCSRCMAVLHRGCRERYA